MLLDRAKLLERQKFEVVKVDLGNDEFVYVREMTGRERDKFEKSLFTEVKSENGEVVTKRSIDDFRAKLAVLTICNEEGESILKPEDFAELSKNIGIKRLEKIVAAAQKLNALTDEDKKALTKNSEGGPAANSSSGSAES